MTLVQGDDGLPASFADSVIVSVCRPNRTFMRRHFEIKTIVTPPSRQMTWTYRYKNNMRVPGRCPQRFAERNPKVFRKEPEADPGTNDAPDLTVLIASEVRFVRESLGAILGAEASISVVGYCADPNELVSLSLELRPDLILLDAAVHDGTRLVRRLREMLAAVRVVVFAINESVESVLAWAQAGIVGYIPNTAASADLRMLVANISAGRQTCSPLVAAGLLHEVSAIRSIQPKPEADTQILTPRELQIVRLIGTGLSNKEIAQRLNIGLATAKSHVHNALGKLNVRRRGQIASWMHTGSSPAARSASRPGPPLG